MATAARSQGVSSRITLALIAGYQRWISPHKGFRCAHSVLHGGTGCSGFAKSAIRQHGVWRALGLIRQRFRDCRAALITLNETAPTDETPPPKGRKAKKKPEGLCNRSDCALAACESPMACCGSGANTKASGAAGGAGLCGGVGASEAAGAGICGSAGEAVAGACGGILGVFSCCGG